MQFVTSRSFEILLRARVDGRKKLAALSRKRKAKNTGKKKKEKKKEGEKGREKKRWKKGETRKERWVQRNAYNYYQKYSTPASGTSSNYKSNCQKCNN